MSIAELEAHLRAHPDDTASWQVYADHLLEQGDVRGELVRLDEAGREALSREHEASWRRDLPAGIAVRAWRHGFVAAVEVVWTADAPGLLADWAVLPASRFATALRIVRPRDDKHPFEPLDLRPLCLLDLARLTALDLAYLEAGDGAAHVLAASPWLRGIATLDLRYDAIGDVGIAALAASPHATGLRTLHLQRNRISTVGAAALAISPYLRDLAALDLRYCAIGAAGAAALARATFAPRLALLRLLRADIGDDGVAALAASEQLAPVQRAYWRGIRDVGRPG